MKQNYQNSLFRKKLNGGGNLWSRFQNLLLLMLCLVCSTNVMAETAVLSFNMGRDGADATSANSITGASGCAAEGWTIAITGNTGKNWSAGNGSITYGGKTYKTLKNSNGAQNTITLPDGYVASSVTFYVTTNADDGYGKLSEINGTSCNDEVSTKKDYNNPTVITKALDNASSFTFTFGTKQVCFIAVVTYNSSKSIVSTTKALKSISINDTPFDIANVVDNAATISSEYTTVPSVKFTYSVTNYWSDDTNTSADDETETITASKDGDNYVAASTMLTNNVTLTFNNVVLPDYTDVTFGLTRPLTKTDETTGTMGDPVWTNDGGITISEIKGSDITIDGNSRNYTINDVTYSTRNSYKKTVKSTSFGEDRFAGYSFTVPTGKQLDIKSVHARLSDASNCTWTWKIEVQKEDGTVLWNTSNKTTSNNSTTVVDISDASLQTKLGGLTKGTYLAKIYFYQDGSTKCNTIDLTFTGQTSDVELEEYNVTFNNNDAEANGVVPEAVSVVEGDYTTIPVNATLYKAGYTLTGWNDGAQTYAIGSKFYPTAAATLTPVFAANTEALNEFKKATEVIWYFGKSNGAPEYTGTATAQVKQVKVNTTTVDLGAVMAGGKNSGRNDEWMNADQKNIFVPVCNGAEIETKVYYTNDAVINDETLVYDAEKNGPVGNVKYTYTYNGEGNSVAVNVGNQFISYIKVTYPGSSDPWANFEDVTINLQNNNFMSAENDGKTLGFKKSGDNVVACATDDADAIGTITGKLHNGTGGDTHGLQNFSMSIGVPGYVKITAGTCAWGSNLTITGTNGFNATVNLNGTCYDASKGTGTVIAYYNINEGTTLTIAGGSYMSFIKVESVNEIPVAHTVTYKNGETTVGTKQIYDGTTLGTLPAAPAVADGKRFHGWYSAIDGTGFKAASDSIVKSDMTFYAFIMDKPQLENGYYMVPNNGTPGMNGEALLNAIEFVNELNATAKIFLKNGTYDLGKAWQTQVNANISIIGESATGVKVVNHPTKEGIQRTGTLWAKGENIYLQDLTLRCDVSYPESEINGVGVALRVDGDRHALKNVRLECNQDTYYSNGNASQRGYLEDCYIEGTVDYICGGGNIWFQNTTLYNNSRSNADVITAPSTSSSTEWGYVFMDCTIDAASNQIGKYNLGRPWKDSPAATFINTTMKQLSSTAAWTKMGTGMKLRFHEYGTKDASGNLINLSGRSTAACSPAAESDACVIDAATAATYTLANVLGGWDAAAETAQKTVSNVALNGTTLSWEGDADAYLIEKNGEFVAIVTENTATVDANAEYTVRAANARGGFGEGAQNAVSGITFALAVNNATFSCTPSSTDGRITEFADFTASMTAKADAKANLTRKIDASQPATVGFTVPAGYKFVPYSVSVPVQPVTDNSQVTIALGDLSKTFSNTQGVITTNILENKVSKEFTGDVTLSITIEAGGCATYRLGTPITIKGELVELASATMTCGANKYGTFVAPFDVELPGDVVAYSAAVNGDKVSLTKIAEAGETLAAGTPVIIKSVNGLAATTFYGNATVSENPEVGCLVGLLTNLTVPVGAYVLQTQGGVQAFYKLAQNATGAVNRCYVTINSSNAKFAISIADEEATANDVVEVETVKVLPVKFFKNNQLVIMKNGKQYNAAGAEK